MAKVEIYATDACPFCDRAQQSLKRKGVRDLEKILVDRDPEALQSMIARSGRRTVPQIYIDGRHVGGFDDLSALDGIGLLDAMLAP